MIQNDNFQSRLNSAYWGGACGEPGVGDVSNEYMEDCLSLITNLNSSYWASFHKYRIEWQPGEDGYLEWLILLSIHTCKICVK